MHIQFKPSLNTKDLVLVSSRKYRIKFLNRGKSSKPATINSAEIIIFSYDKARMFAIKLASNCFFRWQGQPFTRFPPSQGAQTVISITTLEARRLIKCLDTKKSTGPDKISEYQAISPILAILFSHCLKCPNQLCDLFLKCG